MSETRTENRRKRDDDDDDDDDDDEDDTEEIDMKEIATQTQKHKKRQVNVVRKKHACAPYRY